jgi:Tfp pilus assembly protein PilF
MPLYGQNERKVIREGLRSYEEGNYPEAEVQFRKAESLNQESYEALFNTGAALYEQEKFEETVKQYESLLPQTQDVEKTAKIWHNIGNSLLEAQQYGPSIEAYKNSLRKDPTDDDTRYNLAYAKQKLNEQQQQQQQQQENQDQDQQEDQQQQENEQDQQGDQQEQENEQDQKGDQQEQENDPREQEQDGDQQDQEDEQEQQPVPREISKEDAERMLNAIQQQEKDVKEKVDKKKAAVAKVKTEKDW